MTGGSTDGRLGAERAVALLVLLLCWLPGQAFDLTLIQTGTGRGNTWTWIHSPDNQPIDTDIRFHDALTGRLVYEWRGSWDAEHPAWLRFSLPAGTYEVKARSGAESLVRRYTCHPRDPRSGIFMSDLVLAQHSFRQLAGAVPLAGAGGAEAGWLGLSLQCARPEPLAIRAVLYQRGYDAPLAETFVPVYEQAQVLPPATATVWTMPMHSAPLTEGEYRIEVWLYQGGELVGRKTLQFARPWTGEKAVRADIETAINQMRYIFPARLCDSLLHLPTPEGKYRAWREAWEQRYAAQAPQEIRFYYTRMEEAVHTFGSWRCHRAAVYMRYGPPGHIRKEPGGETWVYRFGTIAIAP